MIKQRTARRVMDERYDVIFVGRWAAYESVEMCIHDAYLAQIMKLNSPIGSKFTSEATRNVRSFATQSATFLFCSTLFNIFLCFLLQIK
jgi:hypothetical protein